jgi:hypothetical protein
MNIQRSNFKRILIAAACSFIGATATAATSVHLGGETQTIKGNGKGGPPVQTIKGNGKGGPGLTSIGADSDLT